MRSLQRSFFQSSLARILLKRSGMSLSSTLKGFFYEGPKAMVRDFLDLTPLEGAVKRLQREVVDPGITSRMLSHSDLNKAEKLGIKLRLEKIPKIVFLSRDEG